MSRLPWIKSLVFAFTLFAARAAFAVYPEPPPEGPRWTSSDGEVSILAGDNLQLDGRYFGPQPAAGAVHQFLVRRLEPSLDGEAFKYFAFRIMPDFAGGKLVLFDAYATIKPWKALQLQVGKFKVPFGLERAQWPNTVLLFIERALPSNLAPDRDVGAQLGGELFGSQLVYALAVLNGTPDGGNGDVASNGYKDLAARLLFHPLRNTSSSPWNGFSLGVAGTWGIHKGNKSNSYLPTYRTTGQNTFFAYQTSTTGAGPAFADGVNRRFSPQAYYRSGPFAALFEYIWSWQDVTRGTAHARVGARSWEASAAVVVTGGHVGLLGLDPTHPLNPAKGTWGDVELVVRYHRLLVDPVAFQLGFADPTSVASAIGLDAGINWYLNRNVKLAVDYARTNFGSVGASRPPENAWLGRVQWVF